jgi:DNA end-binding protein Ku
VPDADSVKDVDDERARPFWSGLLSFGLVSIPVDLFPAHRGGGSSLRMLDEDGTPLARRYYCPDDEKEIDSDHLEHGYELDNGKVVVVTDEELESLAPKKSREIDLRLFVDRDSIDPLYFQRSYFLAPGSESGKAYRLLGAVMERSRRAGVATFVMRDKEYLVAIFAEGGLLRAETLRFADEVRSPADVGLPKKATLEPKVSKKVSQAVAALEQKHWSPSDILEPRDAIRKLAEEKYRKKKDVVESGESAREEGGQVIDLMEVLKRSLAESGLAPKGRSSAASSKTRAARSTRKTASGGSKRAAKPRTKSGTTARRSKSAARSPQRRR